MASTNARASLGRRLWSRVNKMGPVPSHRPELGRCWIWTRACAEKGYGLVWGPDGSGARMLRVHRVVWEMEHGAVPDGLFVLHRCDNPPCCNPALETRMSHATKTALPPPSAASRRISHQSLAALTAECTQLTALERARLETTAAVAAYIAGDRSRDTQRARPARGSR